MNNNNVVVNPENSLSWPAIIAGLMWSSGIGALMSLIGLAVAGKLIEADLNNAVPSTGSLTWITIAGMVSLAGGAMMTGFFAKTLCKMTGAMQGLIMWSLSLLLGLALVASGAGLLVTGSGQLIGSTLSLAGKSLQQVVPNSDQVLQWIGRSQNNQLDSINNQIKQLLNQYRKNDPSKSGGENNINQIIKPASDIQSDILQALKDYLNNNNTDDNNNLRQTVVSILNKNTSLTSDEIDSIINAWQARYEEITERAKDQMDKLKEKAAAAGKRLSGQLGKASGISFLVLLLGALASAFGGAMGVVMRENSMDHTKKNY